MSEKYEIEIGTIVYIFTYNNQYFKEQYIQLKKTYIQ